MSSVFLLVPTDQEGVALSFPHLRSTKPRRSLNQKLSLIKLQPESVVDQAFLRVAWIKYQEYKTLNPDDATEYISSLRACKPGAEDIRTAIFSEAEAGALVSTVEWELQE